MRTVRLQAEALVRCLLDGQLRSMQDWGLFGFKDAHACQEFARHVQRGDMESQLAMVSKMAKGTLPIEVPDDSGWYLPMPGGYAIEGIGLEGRTYIGKTEALMPKLVRVDNPYMSEEQRASWRLGI